MTALATLALGAPAASALPENRAYEMVSPSNKNGAIVQNDSDGSRAQAAASGSALAYGGTGAVFAGAGGSIFSQYLARRSASGWVTEGLNTPLAVTPVSGVGSQYQLFSSDLSRAVLSSFARLVPDTPGPFNAYLRDNATGAYDLLTRATVPVPQDPQHQDETQQLVDLQGIFAGASADLSRVFFMDWRKLTAAAPLASPNNRMNLYEWAAGTVRLASVLPSGLAAAGPVSVGGRQAWTNNAQRPGDRVVSRDGSRVFFTLMSSQDFGQLFVRVDGVETIQISASEGPDVAGAESFQLASADGSVAVFTSSKRLTDDSDATGAGCVALGTQCDLYRWDADAPVGSRLTDLTPAAGGAGAVAAVASSEDASRVYFVAAAVLADGAVAGAPNLYLSEIGQPLRLVATLDGSFDGQGPVDRGVWSVQRGSSSFALNPAAYRETRATDDGGVLLFSSRAKLTDYDNAGRRQIYRYDTVGDDLRCVSCSSLASSSSGDAALVSHAFSTADGGRDQGLPRNLSADGQRVFFDTTEALVPEDTNGRLDVYLWEDGAHELISSGTGAGPSRFADASTSGDDAFFTTAERLVSADADDLPDLYDARVGGGFPDPFVHGDCFDDACQGLPTEHGRAAGPATESPAGARDRVLGPRGAFSIRRPTARDRAALARRGRAAVRVRVNRSSRISLVARARLGRSTRRVANATERAARAGVVRVPLALSTAARAHLARVGRLRVTVLVRVSGVREPKRVVLSLERPPGADRSHLGRGRVNGKESR